MLLPVHVAAGAVAILTGYLALFATKGASVHRRSGTIFVCAMLVMALTGAIVAAGRPGAAVNIPAGLVTAYLIATAYVTVRPRSARLQTFERAAMIAAFLFGAVASAIAVSGSQGAFTAPLLMFAGIALLGGNGDRRMLRTGGLDGAARLKRHLWRMCTGLFVAAASFFLGPPARVPEPLRLPPFRILPLVALAAMAVWLWRLRARRTSARVLTAGVSEAL
ncbi:MAG TPA: DUF2306 domain-containing protein [Vicinamibacterales bacterium]|nr:DUF2306 domain-containing protein [Vicinamibacterales bacterium]